MMISEGAGVAGVIVTKANLSLVGPSVIRASVKIFASHVANVADASRGCANEPEKPRS
jgi:hypothetical protein